MIYVGFFVPGIAARAALSRQHLVTDPGTLALLVAAAGVLGALACHVAVRHTPMRWLFERPAWLRAAARFPGRRAGCARCRAGSACGGKRDRMIRQFLALAVAACAAATVAAGEADVVDAKVRRSAPGVYDFDVTVRSADKGWD